ncbi:MAG: WecB/TagA/CpsF family glycosyltransferase [Phycisphaerales bacterium]|nr:WecB/TagA/CpsF family glycosyltransferase [Phycisphaerales bacterium]MCB9835361.1 WecB/TagA/CpsF family glycosyltransferase [Phycisphaera sp.]
MSEANYNSEPARVIIAGAWVHKLTMSETIDRIDHAISNHTGGWVVTPNLDILHKLTHDTDFARLVEPATLRLADGMPLVWASKLSGDPLPERVAGSDLVWHICERAAERNYSVFLLGGDEGIADKAAAVLQAKYKGLRVVGTHCPPFGFEKNPDELNAISAKLSQSEPDIILVALGCPKQERLIDTLRADYPKAWFFGIGISLSFVTGDVKRAPTWIRRLGLEWVHRLLQEPGRLAKRYILVGIPFAFRVLGGSILARFRG